MASAFLGEYVVSGTGRSHVLGLTRPAPPKYVDINMLSLTHTFDRLRRPLVLWPLAVLAGSAVLVALDWVTGPYVRVSLLFIFPVALVAFRWGVPGALGLGVLLLVSRIWLVIASGDYWLVLPEVANLALGLIVFAVIGIAACELRRTRALVARAPVPLAVCGGCGRIRGREGRWHGFVQVVTRLKAARFRHTLCPECEHAFAGQDDIHGV